MSRPFPSDSPMLRGPWQPWPMEGEIHDCAVVGELPRELHGTLYRNGPNPQYAPPGSYHFFLADGMVHAFHFENGRCSYRNRWVRTPRFLAERAAGRPLFGNLFAGEPNDPAAARVPNGPANTNVVWHAGRLLALVEGGLAPVELDPDTLETRGIHEFAGALRRPIDPGFAQLLGLDAPDGKAAAPFTAHPKLDPETGEMLAFGYSAIAPWLLYYEIAADGAMVRHEPIDAPFPSMVHDFVTTRERVVFPIFPATLRPERALRGESVLGWEPELGARIGVMARRGPAAVRWFETDPCYVFHPVNAYDDGPRVVADVAQYPRLPLPLPGEDPGFSVQAKLVRWTLDLEAGTLKQEPLDERSIEFPRCDERFVGLPYRYGFAGSGSRTAVHGFDQLVRYDLARGAAAEVHAFAPEDAVGEPIFVPRRKDAPEGDGWLLALVWRGAEDRSDLVVLDAGALGREPVAVVRLPHRVPAGFHGNFRDLRG